jgi:SAM-dependent methyltransferase
MTGHADPAWERERARLAWIGAVWDAWTFRHLEQIGVGPGWRCVDVGAGAGSVPRWLAARVAPEGRVVATDVEPRLLSPILPAIEARRHDIAREPLEDQAYDLVHARLLLQHVTDPAATMRHLAGALARGAWLVVEELDYSCCGAASRHGRALFDRVQRATERALMPSGFDPQLGRRLPELVRAVGLEPAQTEGWFAIDHGGSPCAEWFRTSLAAQRADLVRGDGIDEGQLDRVMGLLQEPGFSFVSPALVTIMARRHL